MAHSRYHYAMRMQTAFALLLTLTGSHSFVLGISPPDPAPTSETAAEEAPSPHYDPNPPDVRNPSGDAVAVWGEGGYDARAGRRTLTLYPASQAAFETLGVRIERGVRVHELEFYPGYPYAMTVFVDSQAEFLQLLMSHLYLHGMLRRDGVESSEAFATAVTIMGTIKERIVGRETAPPSLAGVDPHSLYNSQGIARIVCETRSRSLSGQLVFQRTRGAAPEYLLLPERTMPKDCTALGDHLVAVASRARPAVLTRTADHGRFIDRVRPEGRRIALISLPDGTGWVYFRRDDTVWLSFVDARGSDVTMAVSPRDASKLERLIAPEQGTLDGLFTTLFSNR